MKDYVMSSGVVGSGKLEEVIWLMTIGTCELPVAAAFVIGHFRILSGKLLPSIVVVNEPVYSGVALKMQSLESSKVQDPFSYMQCPFARGFPTQKGQPGVQGTHQVGSRTEFELMTFRLYEGNFTA